MDAKNKNNFKKNMAADRTIINIDARIAKMRQEIEKAPDKSTDDIITTQREIDVLIAERYARLLELEKQSVDNP